MCEGAARAVQRHARGRFRADDAQSQHGGIAAIYATPHPVLLHELGVDFALGRLHAAGAARLAKLLQSGFTAATRTKKKSLGSPAPTTSRALVPVALADPGRRGLALLRCCCLASSVARLLRARRLQRPQTKKHTLAPCPPHTHTEILKASMPCEQQCAVSV